MFVSVFVLLLFVFHVIKTPKAFSNLGFNPKKQFQHHAHREIHTCFFPNDLQGGLLVVMNGVVIPLLGIITSVTHC